MKKRYLISFYLSTTLAALAAMAIVGCGGGGGPISNGSSGSTASIVSPSAAFKALLPAAQANAKNVGTAKCATCHAAEATQLAKTIHGSKNVGCESCHGPGSVHAANPSGYQSNILTYAYGTETASVTSYVVCNQCHGTQAGQWTTLNSAGLGHSAVVSNFVGLAGTASMASDVPNCFRCHSGDFRAQYVDTPLSQGQTPSQVDTAINALNTTQQTAAANSINATAECVVCHDPHQNTSYMAANTSTNGGQYMLRRATSSQDTADIGANVAVATYTTYNQLCGSCHNTRAADPSDSGLAKSSNTSRAPVHHGPEMNMLLGTSGVESNDSGIQSPPRRQGTHASAQDQCVTCHMPSASHTFTVQLDTSCSPCHSASDAASRESSEQGQVLSELNQLQSTLSSWAVSKFGAGNTDSWDYTSNIPTGQTVPKQDNVTIPLEIKRARYNYWFVIIDGSYGVHNPFYTDFMLQIANDNLNELLGTSTPLAKRSNQSTAQLKAFYEAQAARIRESNSCIVTPSQTRARTSSGSSRPSMLTWKK